MLLPLVTKTSGDIAMFLPVCLLLAVSAASAAENKRLVMHSDLDLATTLGHLQQNLSDVGNKVLQQGSRIAQLEAENQQLNSQVTQQNTRVLQLETENRKLNNSVTQQNARVVQLETENRKLNNSVTQQHTRVLQLETENRKLNNSVTQQNTRVLQLETENRKLNNGVTQQNTRVVQLEAENQQFKADNNQLNTSVTHQSARIAQLESTTRGLANSGKGIIGGSLYTSKGGGPNSLCLPENPTWNKYVDGNDALRSAIYGSEVEDSAGFSTKAFGYNYMDQDPPCATCHTQRTSVVMIPGRSNCYPGWTMEYTGYLVGGNPNYESSDYICLDSKPEELPHGLDSNSNNQHILHFVEGQCGSLPCPPYHEGREIACTVCSK